LSEAVVLDASAVHALMDGEPGAGAVAAVLQPGRDGLEATECGMPAGQAHADALALGVDVMAFDGNLSLDVGARWEPVAKVVGVTIRNIRPRGI
jgi:hypothetical protein